MLRTVDVPDISDGDTLIRYAVNAQLAHLLHSNYSHADIAKAIGLNPGNLSHKLGSPQTSRKSESLLSEPPRFTSAELQHLDEVIVAASRQSGRYPTGGLASLAVRLRRTTDRASLPSRVPPSWTSDLLKAPSQTELGVLEQASALLSTFLAADTLDQNEKGTGSRAVDAVRTRYPDQLQRVVRQLILVGMAPPTSRNVEALIMLGDLANYSFDLMRPLLEDALRNSPLGFRVWRAITKLVKLSKRPGAQQRALREWVRDLIEDAENLREASVYPGRSLDLELAITIPDEWSTPDRGDYVHRALLARAYNQDATIRERGTAAMGLWQRAVRSGADLDEAAKDLDELISEFEDANARPDAHRGMQWVAVVLRQMISEKTAACNHWPDIQEDWLLRVHEAAEQVGGEKVDDHIGPGTRTLFKHALLQNAGVYRRQALETLIAGGYTKPVADALRFYLDLEKEESWIRIRAIFALGFLQHQDSGVVRTLIAASQQAADYVSDEGVERLTKAQQQELHTALFAVGDCYGAEGTTSEERANLKADISEILEHLVTKQRTHDKRLWLPARALAYTLTFTAMPRVDGREDLSERLLKELRAHPDSRTRTFSDWALKFRFEDTTGDIKPLVAAGTWS